LHDSNKKQLKQLLQCGTRQRQIQKIRWVMGHL
jgi:hypothetical protein